MLLAKRAQRQSDLVIDTIGERPQVIHKIQKVNFLRDSRSALPACLFGTGWKGQPKQLPQ